MVKDALLPALLLLALFACPLHAAANTGPNPAGKSASTLLELTDSEKQWLEQHPVIRARVGTNPPLHFYDGQHQGISVDYFNRIAEIVGFDVEYVHDIPWHEAIENIKKGEGFDLLLTAKNTKERQASMRFSDDYLLMPWVIFSRTKSEFIGSIDDLTGRTVAVERSFVMQERLTAEYPGIKLLERKHSLEALEAVSSGAADAYIGNLATSTYLINKHHLANLKVACPASLGNHDQAFTVRYDWPEFVTILNKAIKVIPDREMTELRNKWFNVKFEYGISTADLFKWIGLIGGPATILLLFFAVWNRRLTSEIRERRQAQKSLRDVMQFNEKIISESPIGLAIYDAQSGQCIATNEAMAQLIGATRDKVIEQNFKEIESWESSGLLADVHEVLKEKRSKRTTIETKTSHGVDVALDCYLTQFDFETSQHLFLAATDVTQKRQAEQTILRQRERAELYFNLAGVMFIGLDSGGKINVANRKACQILEIGQEEVIGQDWIETFIPPETRQEVHSVFQQILDGDIKPVEYYENLIISKSGKEKHIAWHNTIIRNESGKIIGLLGSGEDITEKKQLRQKLQQSQKMESIGTLAGGIAHDFNNILSSIIGFGELALGGVKKGSEVEDDIREVLTAGMRAKELVKQILTFARQSDEAVKPVQVKTIARETLKFLKSSLPANIRIEEKIASDSFIMGAPTQVHQVFMNLCTNASQAMEEDGGILEVRVEDATIDSTAQVTDLKPGEYVTIIVKDAGPGIAARDLTAIFEPYYTTKKIGEGTGMGLAVVHGIVESYGGKIDVDSSAEHGTTFFVYLPLTKKRKKHAGPVSVHLPSGTEHILLVDDEASIVKMETRTLEQLGYTVTSSTVSTDALALFQSTPEKFDLLVTDMTMPGMTGDKLAGEVLSIRPEIPVILCTGYNKRISDKNAAELGITALVLKPISKEDFANTVREVLDETVS